MADWIIRPYPHDKPRIDEFRTKQIVAVGWPFTGDARELSEEELQQTIEARGQNWTAKKIANGVETVRQFCHEMSPGDLVLVVPQKKDFGGRVMLAQVEGDYEFEPKLANDREGYPHLRKVRWVRPLIARNNLPSSLDAAIAQRGMTLAKIEDDALRSHAASVGWI